MVLISEQEKKYIAERHPEVHICRTVSKKSKRHRYYMEENRAAMRTLKALRSLRYPDRKDGGGADG